MIPILLVSLRSSGGWFGSAVGIVLRTYHARRYSHAVFSLSHYAHIDGFGLRPGWFLLNSTGSSLHQVT